MATMEIQGRIIKINPTQTVGQNGFQRRDVVIMTEEQYPQYIPFDFVQEKCVLLDAFQEGQAVRISFNIRGREWVNPQGETKYIVNLQGWRIENAEMGQGQPAYAPQYGQPAYPPQGYGQPQYGQVPQYQQIPPQYQQVPPQYPTQAPQQAFQPTPQQAFGAPTTAPAPQQGASASLEEDDLPF